MDENKLGVGTLYQMNKEYIRQNGKSIKGKALYNKISETLIPYVAKLNEKYFMLLCNEKKDYTIFHCNSAFHPTFVSEFKETICNRGEIYSISRDKDENALEIWIRDTSDNEMYVYYFFPYDSGVIEV